MMSSGRHYTFPWCNSWRPSLRLKL